MEYKLVLKNKKDYLTNYSNLLGLALNDSMFYYELRNDSSKAWKFKGDDTNGSWNEILNVDKSKTRISSINIDLEIYQFES